MTHFDRGRVKTWLFVLPMAAADRKRADVAHVQPTSSGSDGLHQRLDAEDIDHPLHVIGEHLQTHFRFDLFKPAFTG